MPSLLPFQSFPHFIFPLNLDLILICKSHNNWEWCDHLKTLVSLSVFCVAIDNAVMRIKNVSNLIKTIWLPVIYLMLKNLRMYFKFHFRWNLHGSPLRSLTTHYTEDPLALQQQLWGGCSWVKTLLASLTIPRCFTWEVSFKLILNFLVSSFLVATDKEVRDQHLWTNWLDQIWLQVEFYCPLSRNHLQLAKEGVSCFCLWQCL